MDETLIARYPELEATHFWWSVRRQFVLDMFEEAFPSGNATVLDIGCGSGMTARLLSKHGANVVGVDLSLASHQASTPNLRLVEADYLTTAESLGEFDLVLALDAVEHFESETAVLTALASNTRPGGKVLITVPAFKWLWSSHDEQNQHYRRYTRGSLVRALTSAGFEPERAGYIFLTLVLPKLVLALRERVTSKAGSSGTRISPWVNSVADAFCRRETHLAASLTHFWPFGTSVVAIARRRSP